MKRGYVDPSQLRGRPRQLTQAQQASAVRRYRAWQNNRPKRICEDLGISRNTLLEYIRRTNNGAIR
jgi:hypothetical protein